MYESLRRAPPRRLLDDVSFSGMSTPFVDQLRQQRAQAVAERERLDTRIRALDVLISQEAGAPTTQVTATASATWKVHGRKSLPDAVTEALTEAAGRPLDFAGLMERVRAAQGSEVNENSLRGTLPRMEREGRIVKPRRGLYALPENAESPTDDTAGPSDLSDQPGEEVIPDGNPAHRDLGPSSGGWLDRGHDHGASVAG